VCPALRAGAGAGRGAGAAGDAPGPGRGRASRRERRRGRLSRASVNAEARRTAQGRGRGRARSLAALSAPRCRSRRHLGRRNQAFHRGGRTEPMRRHLCRRVPRGGVAPNAARGLGVAARRARRKTGCKPGAGDRQGALRRAGRPPRRRRARARPLSPAPPSPSRAAACRRGLVRLFDLVNNIVDYVTFLASALPMATTSAIDFEQRVGAVRRFNRLYTRRIGVLQDGFLQSPYSLAEARVLYELAQRERPTATELAADLGLDHGYLSRILRGFNERGFITKAPSPHDRRQILLSLTAKGRMAFAPLDQRSQNEIAAMIGKL